ncbi:MAG: FtsQ-type POTRA domain-containing protein [Clostridia bacterium]|nr:FtsQ-type POTRA domain-containing protein [Clostridia bacterium]
MNTNTELSAYAQKKKQRILIRNLFVTVLVLAILGTAGYFVSTRFLIARSVNVQGTDLYPKEEILKACAIEDGAPLISLSKKEISRAVEENFPYLVDVSVEFDLPQTVNVTFREEFGHIALMLGTELFSVDDQMNVLAKESQDSTIPRIRLITRDVSRCIVGEKLAFFDEKIVEDLEDVVSALSKAEMLSSVSTIDIQDKFNIEIRYLDRFQLLIGDSTDLKYKFAMVKKIIADLGEGEIGRIDIADPNTAYVKLGVNP